MTPTANKNIVIKWQTKDKVAIEAIRKRFGIPKYTTVNGLSPAEVTPEDWSVFEECANRHFFGIMDMEWHKNGAQYIFISR